MAHVGKIFPVFFNRDYNPSNRTTFGPVPWRYKLTCGIARPGPFVGWAGKTIIGEEPVMESGNSVILWSFLPPSGADPTTSVELRYRLTFTESFWTADTKYLMSAVTAVDGGVGTVGTGVSDLFGPATPHVHSPPWPGAVPWIGPIGSFHACSWADLGVTAYPGYSIA